jgi:hypothetical protein
MSSRKILDGWKRNIPPRVPLKDVLIVLKDVFETVEQPKRGSHLKVYDSRFEALIRSYPGSVDFSYDGRFTIPHAKGKEVKKVYIKRILNILEWIHKETTQ